MKEEKKQLRIDKRKEKKDRKLNRTFKQKFIDRFLIFIITISIIVALYVPIRNLILKWFSDTRPLTAEIVKENMNKPFKTEDIEPVTDKDLLTGINWNQGNVIGAIYMPTIKTGAMISRGFTNEGMYTSVGTMTENQTMGKGNYPLAGHNMYVPHVLFTSIDQLQVGDFIYLTDATYIYTYETSEVLPRADITKISISGQRNKDEVTLMSCTDDAYNTNFAYRKVVRGNFVKKELIKDSDKKVIKAFKLS